MFWNNDFLNAAPSVFDTLLQSDTTKLSDILFQEDLLQELRTSNISLTNYLAKPEIINELVDNITRLTEKDCYDKLLYSKVHAAYISCEILTAGSNEITDALLSQTNSLTKIISCLVRQPDDDGGDIKRQQQQQPQQQSLKPEDKNENIGDAKDDKDKDDGGNNEAYIESNIFVPESCKTREESDTDTEKETTSTEQPKPCQELQAQQATQQQSSTLSRTSPPPSSPSPTPTSSTSSATTPPIESIRVVPQKAALVSKLISNIHSAAPADLSCPITKNIDIFSSLIQVLVNNIDVSGSFEILSTFISRTTPPESRYVFCEILSKLNFVFSLINVMTLSNVEDKQRNACQLLCDIIVIGRQEANEQITNHGPAAQDMLAELIESREAVHLMLNQMFPHKLTNSKECQDANHEINSDTSEIVTTTENATNNHNGGDGDGNGNDGGDTVADDADVRADGDDKNDSSKHNGITVASIKKDDINGGFETSETALETPNKTAIVCGMKVLQTLVERKHAKNNAHIVARTIEQIQDEIAENLIYFHELLLNPPKQEPIKTTFGVIQKPLGYIRLEVVNLIRELLSTGSPVIIKKLVELKTFKIIIDLFVDYSWNNLLHTQVEQAVHLIIKNCRRDEDLKYQVDMQKHSSNNIVEPINYDLPSLALLSQLLNECDLIGRLLMPDKNGEQANFGHIIQMINSIAISGDLDTIKDHLDEMKDKRPDLHASWTNFVNVDVASFKAISLYFDVQSVSNHTDNNYEYLQKRNLLLNDERGYYLPQTTNHNRSHLNTLSNNSPSANNDNVKSLNGDDHIMTYSSFTKETVIPSINVDVIPKSRRPATTNKNNY